MEKKNILGGAFGALLLTGCIASADMAMADNARETRDLDTFDEVIIGGAMDITIEVGKAQSVTIDVDEDYLEDVVTEVRNGKLRITQEGRRWYNTELKVHITVADLNGFQVDGAVDATIKNIDSDDFDLEIGGAADLELTGKCGEARFEINGAGDIDAKEFECKSVEVIINGAGDADVFASDTVIARLSGIGNVVVWGEPKNVRPKIDGLGSFEVK